MNGRRGEDEWKVVTKMFEGVLQLILVRRIGTLQLEKQEVYKELNKVLQKHKYRR